MKTLLKELDLPQHVTLESISWGRDSQVYKVKDGRNQFALRVLPSNRHDQFVKEEKTILYAKQHGIPVSNVHKVVKAEDYSAMLMEWADGKTLLHQLQETPEHAKLLGEEFGHMQAKINRVNYNQPSNLLLSNQKEKRMLDSIKLNNHFLIHLDFHPLNVLTDGLNITAVLDLVNAGAGDPRLDYARTQYLLKMVGDQYLEEQSLKQFLDGWRKGIGGQKINQALEEWAEIRTKRDLGLG
ncbi:hypothetical protein E3U55_06325 [Filobacillus milosensis]|uniref:Protein kinase domain-containing protein n=1 Tax=Filobacillus milosensis TaxID=94137 RepID=A0A4Y8IQN7_9BACI|nr:phosphotransferase [Filobacillus milosensis]TFB22850.1 hypothetical protein E3U55_06325 [Filobacillus milosensis]